MAEERGTYAFAIEWLRMLGYSPDVRMAGVIARYWGWYTADNRWYHYRARRGFKLFRSDRETLHPAALAAEAWSDLLMNEKLEIAAEDDGMRVVLEAHFGNFGVAQADFTTRAFALGTGAWAIGVDDVSDDGMMHPDARVKIEDYDAHQVMPITWSADSCTQCAFVTRVELGGRDYDQCQAHVLLDGTYHILTQLFDVKSHRMVFPEGVTSDLDTKSPHKTFALVRPAVPNQHFSYCAMGASVFDKGVSAIKATDEALTSLLAHLRVARPKMFVADELIEKKVRRGADGKPLKGADGKPVTEYYAFGEADDIVFRTPPGPEGVDPLKVVQPDMRIADNERAINTGLKMLSLTCGLGDQYWGLGPQGRPQDRHRGGKRLLDAGPHAQKAPERAARLDRRAGARRGGGVQAPLRHIGGPVRAHIHRLRRQHHHRHPDRQEHGADRDQRPGHPGPQAQVPARLAQLLRGRGP